MLQCLTACVDQVAALFREFVWVSEMGLGQADVSGGKHQLLQAGQFFFRAVAGAFIEPAEAGAIGCSPPRAFAVRAAECQANHPDSSGASSYACGADGEGHSVRWQFPHKDAAVFDGAGGHVSGTAWAVNKGNPASATNSGTVSNVPRPI